MENVVIICGGKSAEHEISLRSAHSVVSAIDRDRFNPILVIISKSGCWHIASNELLSSLIECTGRLPEGAMCTIARDSENAVLLTIDTGRITSIDMVFPLLHGPMGEDGTLQGLLEFIAVPYVGSGVLASAICMDKLSFKQMLSVHGLLGVPYIVIDSMSRYMHYSDAASLLGSSTLFVKPTTMGSSIGVYKVSSVEGYDIAVKNALKYATKVLVEKHMQCREIECSILGNANPITSALGEVKPNHEFYTYEAKYIDPNGAELIMPALVLNDISEQIKEIAVKIYKTAGCKGLARADFFLAIDNTIYINELNTMPGFTSISMYPKLWEISGFSLQELITKLIELGYEEYYLKQQISLSPFAN